MASISKKEIDKLLGKIGMNISDLYNDPTFMYKQLQKGYKVELEHGRINKITNITNNRKILTLKIALAHLMEFKQYYIYLEKMEEDLKKSIKKSP